MKTRLSVLVFLFASLLFISNTAVAQKKLTKAERKALKKEIKNYKKAPEKYAAMKESNKKTIQTQEQEIETLKQQLAEEWKRVDSLNAALAEAERVIADYEKSAVECGKVPNQGIVYGVQVGNYKTLDLREFFNSNKGLRTETYTDGNAYVIGNFTTVEEAIQFVKDIRKLGVKDAFVTQYIDGVRVVKFDAFKG